MDSFSSLDHKTRSSDNVFVKVLIPSNCGGVVIGKAGQSIVKAQEESGATVKISKVGEYFPETNERICLIHGDKFSISKMIDYISSCVSDKSDLKSFTRLDRQKQTIMVIPNSSAGLLIGREGETISSIKKDSGAFIQVSPKSFNQIGGERCVMISGNCDQRSKATKLVIDKIIDDPKLCSFPNLVYSGDGPNNYPGAVGSGTVHASGSQNYQNAQSGMNMMPSHNYESSGYDKYHYSRLSHFNDGEARGPMNTTGAPAGNFSPNNQMMGSTFNSMQSSTAPRMNNMPIYDDYSPSSNNPMFYKMPSKPQSNVSQSFHQMDYVASNSVNGITRNIDVDEDYVGAIIGPRGSAILELQEITNTNIKVSKKPDSLSPPPSNYNGKRLVSIYGFYQDVSRAYLLICDKIKNEQLRREQIATSNSNNNANSNNGGAGTNTGSGNMSAGGSSNGKSNGSSSVKNQY